MYFLNVLYQIFIAPIELVMRYVLEYSYGAIGSYGLSIIVLGIVVNIALLPFYNLAENWQQDERDKFTKIKGKIDEIKRVFTGQERFMMLKTLYKQNGYHPLLAARNSLGFLIQIPFFFAAFHLLSNYAPLNEQSFGLFKDLGQADGLLSIGGTSINIMPFVMTVVNLLSAYVYASQLQKKDKIQLYTIAAVFLVALYASPVALVFYWTINNLFSLVKNLVYKKYNDYFVTRKLKKTAADANYKKNLSIATPNFPKYFGFLKIFDYKVFLYLAVMALVLALYSAILHKFVLPLGINSNFVKKTRNVFLAFTFLSFILHFLFHKKLKNKLPITNISAPTISNSDWLLLLLPIAPILHYVFLNLELVDHNSIYTLVTVLFLVPAFFILGTTSLLRKIAPANYIFIALLVFAFSLYTMPKLAAMFSINSESSIYGPFWVFVAILLASFFIYSLKRPIIYMLVISLFAVEVYTGIFDTPEDEINITNNIATSHDSINLKKNNSVYFLSYDAYPNIETHELYGIDNTAQIDFLKQSGFSIYNGTYSTSGETIATLGSVFNMKPTVSIPAREAINGYSVSNEILQNNNYKTYGVYPSTYYVSSKPTRLDTFIPKASEMKLTGINNAILEGEFRFNIKFDGLKYNDYIDAKRNLITSDNNVFLQSHGTYPDHTQNSGQCLPNEKELYIDRLAKGNWEMKGDVEHILSVNPNAIIVIAGDHSPYFTKNCFILGKKYNYPQNEIDRLDVQDRFGAFVTIKWPESGVAEKFDIQTVQDIMPAVFAYLADDDSLYEKLRSKPDTFQHDYITNGVGVFNGIISGGANDGEPLFLNRTID